MEVKATKFLKDVCKIHGETDFYIYKGEAHKCAECTKKKSKEWSLKNTSYKKQYSIKYREENQDRIKLLNDRHKEISRRKTMEDQADFYEKFGAYIEEIASKISLKKCLVVKDLKE